MAPEPAPPSGALGKYKRATDYFLRWLLHARADGGFGALEPSSEPANDTTKSGKPTKPARGSDARTVDAYERIVAAIVQAPSTLSEALRLQWPLALAACECAITLRTQVAQFFPPKNGPDSHRYFLQRLQEWLDQLRVAKARCVPVRPTRDQPLPTIPTMPTTSSGAKSLDFANYYDVLELPDDYFDETADDSASSSVHFTPTIDPKQLLEEPFADDAALEVAYFLLELDELAESVYSAFHDVKCQRKSLVEATVVALVAVDFAKGVIARFQLEHPTVRDVADFSQLLFQHMPREHFSTLAKTVGDTWQPPPWHHRRYGMASADQYPYQYVRGTVMLDVLWLDACLGACFEAVLPRDMAEIMDPELYGAPYDERWTPHFAVPAFLPPMDFFMHELALLFNATGDYRACRVRIDAMGFTDAFFAPLLEFFRTRRVTLDAVFVCICWVRAVSALQGDDRLRKTVSLARLRQWDLEARLRKPLARFDLRDKKSKEWPYSDIASVLDGLVFVGELPDLVQTNPIAAGGMLLTHHANYLHVGAEFSVTTAQHLRAFCHIYSALRNRQLLDAIPLIEDVLSLYERFFFTPSRAAAVHGSFLHVYQASCSEKKESATRRRDRRTSKATSAAGDEHVNCHCLQCMSMVVRLLDHHDYSELPPEVLATTSWKARLDGIAALCAHELHGSRVLSRDMFQLSNDIMDLFIVLRDTLGGKDDYEALLAHANAKDHNRVAHQALDDVVVSPLLPLLDDLNLDGTAKVTGLNSASSTAALERGLYVGHYCRRAAAIISATFNPSDPVQIERAYYMFPPTPHWITTEFGQERDPRQFTPHEETEQTFDMLMTMLRESTGPLSDDQVATLKTHVIADPNVLDQAIPGQEVELCTLLHQAAAGRAFDRRLVEWLIQMDALGHQQMHFQNPPHDPAHGGIMELCNCMPVHSAAKAGLTDIVKQLLEADNCEDIDKVTYHTKESLAHIAVRNGDRKTYELLVELGARFCYKDASGKYVHELTTNAKWKQEILSEVILQRADEADDEATNRKPARPRTVEPPPTSKPISTLTLSLKETLKLAKQKKKKGRPPPKATAEDRVLQELVQEFGDLRGNKSPAPSSSNASATPKPTSATLATHDRITQFSHWLDTLKGNNTTASSSERQAAATAAVDMIDAIRANIDQYNHTKNLNQFSRDVVLREASDASRVLFLLTKFHRQLPESTRDLRPDERTALGKLLLRAGPSEAVGDFVLFAMFTVLLFTTCGRLPQAQELLELVERRILKPKPWDVLFCQKVVAYLGNRRQLGVLPVAGSTAEAQRVFQWFVPTADGVSKFTHLGQCSWFRRLVVDGVVASRDALPRLEERVTSRSSRGLSMLCVATDDGVVVAARSAAELNRAVAVVVSVAAEVRGLSFQAHSEADNTTELIVDGLELPRLARAFAARS